MKFPSPTLTEWCWPRPTKICPGLYLPRRTPLSQLVQRNFLHQVKVLAGPTKVFELDFPFSNANRPFGEVRVVLNVGLLVSEIAPSLWTLRDRSRSLRWWFPRCLRPS